MKLKVFCLLSLLLCFMFLFPMFAGQEVVFAEDRYVQVVASQCFLFEDKSFDNPIKNNSQENLIIKHGEKLKVLQDEDQGFIKIEYINEESYQGFVYARYVTYNELTQEVYPVFNASVIENDVIVYNLDESPTNKILSKGKELYLYEGYIKKTEFTCVCFVDEDGSLFYGKIKTKQLAPYGINAGVITGIVVAVSCVTIILLLIFMKKTKKQKRGE